MIKVLHVVSALGGGGVESMLYNYYSRIDRKRIHFDFVVHDKSVGMLEEKFQNLGSKIFHVTPKKNSLLKNMVEISGIIQREKYNVVHCHQNLSNFSTLFLARRNHVPVRISHSHGCKDERRIKEKIKNYILRLLNKSFANYFFSCGTDAGKWLHGKKWCETEKNIIMNNAIDTNKFIYDEKLREYYRKELNIKNNIVLLHVGRFSSVKNHMFMIDIVEQLTKFDDKYIMIFAGNGETEESVKKYAQAKGLTNKVMFLGGRSDISELMNSADIFLLPSKDEGFGITLIEAQSTGIRVLASSRVPKETAITDLIEYLPIDDVNIWIEKIRNIKNVTRNSRKDDVEIAGYSVDRQAIKYIELIERVCSQ